MTPTDALQSHLSLCDELYQLALEENRFLKQNQRVPDAALLDRKRALLARLDTSLAALKQISASPAPARPDPVRKEVIEKARAKILQVLHIDRENEQLLLRYSLGVRPKPAAPPAAAPVSQLQRLYDRHL
ncbi:hypothetical protein DB347_16545 [Opitutaceae bacterium EW11]|nr:hypothetical protein DB347_16545 [Opitutaceae bacterium EW11]